MIAVMAMAAVLVLAWSHEAHAALPDGRAYEQASPVNKNGLSVYANPSLFQAALDGNGVVFFTESPLPGSEGAGNYAPSLASRSTESWSTQGLLTPAGLGRQGRVAGWSEDTKYDYVVAQDPGNGSNFFQRDTSTREVTVIAHFPSEFGLATITPVATSSDDSRLLFEARKQITPEASSENNVYLWNAEDETVHLVSMSNPGEEPIEIATAGAYGWLGFEEISTPELGDAMKGPGVLSSSGTDAIFSAGFTKPQIYLRKNIEATQSQMSSTGECEEPEKACTIKVSASQGPPDPNGEKPATFLAASTQGPQSVFFASPGQLTPHATTGAKDEGEDLYRYNVPSGKLEDITESAETTAEPNGAEVRGILGASASGDRIYFVANGLLGDAASRGASRGDCPFPPPAGARSGECNLYLWESGVGIRYIARLDAVGREDGLEYPLSDVTDWLQGKPSSSILYGPSARVSEDGGIAVFRSQVPLTPSSPPGAVEYYRYMANSGRIVCMTCNPAKVPQMYPPTLASDNTFVASIAAFIQPRNLSANGNRFFFETSEALAPEDTNGELGCPPLSTPDPGTEVPKCQDVYEWEASGEGSCTEASPAFHAENGGCLFLISTGTSPEPSFFGDADATGEDAFFLTSSPGLVAQDRDQLADVYDARVGGGLAGQNPPAPSICLGVGECGRSPVAAPAESAPPSLVPSGEKAKKQLRCGRGTKRKKHHGKSVCVQRNATNKHKKHGRGTQNGHGKSHNGMPGRGSK